MKKFLFLICALLLSHRFAYGFGEVSVKTEKVAYRDFYDEIRVAGKVSGDKNREYYANSSGKIDFISKNQGQKVSKGDILLTIDSLFAESLKSSAEATLAFAKLSYDRNSSLFNKKLISQEALEGSKSLYEKAKSDFASAMKTYADMNIIAPFDGFMGAAKVNLGDRVKAGDYLFNLIENSAEKVIFPELPSKFIKSLKTGAKVVAVSSEGREIPGKIEASSEYLSPSGGAPCKVSVAKAEDLLYGSYVETVFSLNPRRSLSVSEKSVLKNDKGDFLYKSLEGTAKRVYVTTGTRMGGKVEILSGDISEGEVIISEGLTKISDGGPVKENES